MIDVSEKMIITIDKPFKKVLIFQLGSLEYFEFKESMNHNDKILEIIETKTYDHLDKTFNKSKPSDIIYDINVKFGSKLFTKRNYCLNIMEDYVLVDIRYEHLENYYNFIKEIEFNYLVELLEKYPFKLYLTRRKLDYILPHSFTGVTLNIPLERFFMLKEFGLV